MREITAAPSGLSDLWFADLTSDSVERLEWTFQWQEPEHWEGKNFRVGITAADEMQTATWHLGSPNGR